MNKIFLIFILSVLFAFKTKAQTEEVKFVKDVTISGCKFLLKEVDIIDYFEESQVELYRGSDKVLNHMLSCIIRDCNSTSVELGTYIIQNNDIIFYSYWAWIGDAPASPYGVRKQRYKVSSNGDIKLVESAIYLEAMRAGWGGYDDYRGVDFIHNSPTDDVEKEMLRTYKKAVEQDYKAVFVADKKSQDKLFKEVRESLKYQIDSITTHWAEIETSFGYKK